MIYCIVALGAIIIALLIILIRTVKKQAKREGEHYKEKIFFHVQVIDALEKLKSIEKLLLSRSPDKKS